MWLYSFTNIAYSPKANTLAALGAVDGRYPEEFESITVFPRYFIEDRVCGGLSILSSSAKSDSRTCLLKSVS